MHKVFVYDKPIMFLQTNEVNSIPDIPGIQIISEAHENLESILTRLEKNLSWTGIVYLCETPDVAWNHFVSLHKLVPAAGGLVVNPKGEFLMIFRRGKWDLPKGKIDYDELPAQAALREVEEECGIRDLKIDKTLPASFHTYEHKGKMILKKTHWFLMRSEGLENLVPQTDEDIEEAVWMTVKSIREKAFGNIYTSIREILEGYFNSLRK